MDNVDKDVQKKQINPSPSLHALFFAPAPDPAAEAGFLAAGVGPAAAAQLGLQGRHLQVIHRQVVEQGLAGDGLEVRREIDEGALAAWQVRVLG